MVGQTLVGIRKNTHLARGAHNTQRIQRPTLILNVENIFISVLLSPSILYLPSLPAFGQDIGLFV